MPFRFLFSSLLFISITSHAQLNSKVIYGEDHRVDVYEAVPALQSVADSTLAMIMNSSLSSQADGSTRIHTRLFSQELNLCSDERFRDQPVAAQCSAFFVGGDLIVTAGHCVKQSSCAATSFVVGFKMLSDKAAQTTVASENVYNCKNVISHQYTHQEDYALVQLDRPVANLNPLKIKRSTLPAVGSDLYVIGHPMGLPTKIAGGAQVRSWDETGTYFTANLDTYGGNSGSAVFDAQTDEVVGILVRGEQDMKYDNQNKCFRSNICDNDKCMGEDVTSLHLLADKIPAL